MAFSVTRPGANNFKCDLLTHRYQFTGEMTAGGNLMRYLTDSARAGIHLINVQATLLDPGGSAMSNFSQEELIVIKEQVVLVRLDDPHAMNAVTVGKDSERLLVYTERFVIQGSFQTSANKNRLIDATEGPTGRWVVASNVFLHPLIPTAKTAPATAKLIALNKTAIQFFHPEKG